VDRIRKLTVVLAPLLVVACGSSQEESLTAVRDSAGITIVESIDGRWTTPQPIVVAQELVLQIGAVEGEEAERLYQVVAVRWLDEDRLVVANLRSELRIYSVDGTLIRTLGSEGDGPGEYRSIVGVGVRSDRSLAVADTRLRRITVVDTMGTVLHTVQSEGRFPSPPYLVGDMWFAGRAFGQLSIDGPRPDRVTDSIVALHVETGQREAWASTPGHRLTWLEAPNGLPLPLGVGLTPIARVGGRADRLVFGSPDKYELRELDQSGRLVRIIRRQLQARPVTDEHRQPYLEEWDRSAPEGYGAPELADSLPHFRAILPDDQGRTWLQIDEGGHRESLEWDVFGADGAFLGRVQLPSGFTPHEVMGGRMVGIWRDELDVEYVQVWSVEIPGAEAP
jgi:hypothetical protein